MRRDWEAAGRRAYAKAIRVGDDVLARTQHELEALGRAELERDAMERDQARVVQRATLDAIAVGGRQVRSGADAVMRQVGRAGAAQAEADRLRIAQQREFARTAAGAGRTALRVVRPGTADDPGPGRLAAEWATALGPQRRDLGPDSAFVQEFVEAPSVRRYLKGYVEDWRAREGGLNGAYTNSADRRATFGLTEFADDLAAGNGASHFVGSWGVHGQRRGEQIDWAADNDTDTTSFFYGRPLKEVGLPAPPNYARPWPGGRTHQTLRFSTDLAGRPLPQR